MIYGRLSGLDMDCLFQYSGLEHVGLLHSLRHRNDQSKLHQLSDINYQLFPLYKSYFHCHFYRFIDRLFVDSGLYSSLEHHVSSCDCINEKKANQIKCLIK